MLIKEQIQFSKNREGLVPVIIQDNLSLQVLMLGYMNKEALEITIKTGKVTFFSRTKKRLWTKGAESGNFLNLVSIVTDCDDDTLLIKVVPVGNTCHLGTKTCWGEDQGSEFGILSSLENTIADRLSNNTNQSYVSGLKSKGLNKIAQKVGEEAVEVVIEALSERRDLFLEECADLLFHFMILLKAKDVDLQAVIDVLKERRKSTDESK